MSLKPRSRDGHFPRKSAGQRPTNPAPRRQPYLPGLSVYGPVAGSNDISNGGGLTVGGLNFSTISITRQSSG